MAFIDLYIQKKAYSEEWPLANFRFLFQNRAHYCICIAEIQFQSCLFPSCLAIRTSHHITDIGSSLSRASLMTCIPSRSFPIPCNGVQQIYSHYDPNHPILIFSSTVTTRKGECALARSTRHIDRNHRKVISGIIIQIQLFVNISKI